MISVKPFSSLIDKIVRITVSGLQPKQKITLQATLVGDKGEAFESHAHYIADEDCTVDVCRQPSVGGSYTGVEAMGLVWGMKAAPGQRKGLWLRKADVTKPYNVLLRCFDGHTTPHETSSQHLSSVTFEKWYMADGVKRIPVKEGRIRGTLFLPDGKEPYRGNYHYFNTINEGVSSGYGCMRSKLLRRNYIFAASQANVTRAHPQDQKDLQFGYPDAYVTIVGSLFWISSWGVSKPLSHDMASSEFRFRLFIQLETNMCPQLQAPDHQPVGKEAEEPV